MCVCGCCKGRPSLAAAPKATWETQATGAGPDWGRSPNPTAKEAGKLGEADAPPAKPWGGGINRCL